MAINLASCTKGEDLLQILLQPGVVYARQVMEVQPIVKTNPSVQAVEVSLFNTTRGLIGNNIVATKSGFANFTDLGFQSAGVYILVFNADGMGGIASNLIIVQVLTTRHVFGNSIF